MRIPEIQINEITIDEAQRRLIRMQLLKDFKKYSYLTDTDPKQCDENRIARRGIVELIYAFDGEGYELCNEGRPQNQKVVVTIDDVFLQTAHAKLLNQSIHDGKEKAHQELAKVKPEDGSIYGKRVADTYVWSELVRMCRNVRTSQHPQLPTISKEKP